MLDEEHGVELIKEKKNAFILDVDCQTEDMMLLLE